MVRFELERDGDVLRVRGTSLARPQDWEAPQQPPPPSIGLLEDRDAYILLDGASAGTRGRFIRDASGAIEWLRWGGRLHQRQ